MLYLIAFAVIILLLQILLFFQIKKRNRKMKEEDVLCKYNINSRSDAWKALADPALPEEDRLKIREYYDSGE